ncbi:MAG TPA: hypothetical protein VNL77_17465 [Roseiflexaceae bacterium]|nr:hypothetical protein [Roseiflexaceae bacterium]
MTYRIFAALPALALLLSAAPFPTPAAHAEPSRPVMAFYYPWYEPGDWSYDRMSDVAAPTYSGGDDNAIRRHIQQADDAGIDALICAWFGPGEDRINKRCRRLMDLVEQSGRDIKVAFMPEQAAWPGLNSVDALAGALGVLQRELMGRPSYFRFQGRPVVFWFNPGSLGGPDAWRQLRDRADGGRGQFWFGGTDNFDYLDVYDALYYYDITWERAPGAAMASYAGRLQRYNQSRGAQRPFIGTVMPGYNDLKVRNGHARDRQNGDYYRATWQAVIDRNAAAVVITSFNEFKEGSHIEPSEQYGDLYLRLTRELSDRYRAGQAAPPPAPAPGGRCRAFPETGHQVCGRILEYWEQNGGLPVFGFPIGPQQQMQVEGRTIQAQWFERNRLELHPGNPRPYDVLLGRLGADGLAAQGRDWSKLPKADPSAPHFFHETGQAIAPEFWGYWSSQGLEFDGAPGVSLQESLALFGLPLTPAQVETNPTNGQPYLTQHFERARFEYHPENTGTPYVVLLGLLGRERTGSR